MIPITLLQTIGFSIYAITLALLSGGTLALGAAMTTLFRRFDKLQTLCFFALTLSLLLLWLPINGQGGCLLWLSKHPIITYLHLSLQLLALGLLALCLFNINPKLETFQKTEGWETLPPESPEIQTFNRLHNQSENYSKLYCFLCLALLGLLPFWLA
jgi:hypothetical protein